MATGQIANVCVPSIMHSGTRFVLNQVLRGYKDQNLEHPEPKYPFSLYRCHITPDAIQKLIPFMDMYPSIVPMRHPARIAKSFRDRGLSYEDYLSQWHALMELSLVYEFVYFHIDLPSIIPYCGRAAKLLGVRQLKVDRNKKYTDHFNIDAPLEGNMDWVDEQILEFYWETI